MNDNINIAEILKDCPKGMELDCLMYDNVTLDCVDIDCIYPIRITTKSGFSTRLTEYGQNADNKDAKCVLYPKGKTTWDGFVPPCEFKDGEILSNGICICIYNGNESGKYYGFYVAVGHIDFPNYFINRPQNSYFTKENSRLATEEEKEKLFQAIKDNGYRWNDDTKTLEKEEKKDKFDITSLKPFDKVLVRNEKCEHWMMEFFEKTYKAGYLCYKGIWKQCVPYEGNQHLLGTTNDCDEFYKTCE